MPDLSRRKLFALGAAAALAPPLVKRLETLVVSGVDAAGAPVAETITLRSMDPSVLWPGVKAWWERAYAERPLPVYTFDDEEPDYAKAT